MPNVNAERGVSAIGRTSPPADPEESPRPRTTGRNAPWNREEKRDIRNRPSNLQNLQRRHQQEGQTVCVQWAAVSIAGVLDTLRGGLMSCDAMWRNPEFYEVPAPNPDEVIVVKKVDLKISANTAAHHTDQYDLASNEGWWRRPALVIRRGQEFSMELELSRPFDGEQDDLRLIFEIGISPSTSNGTLVEFLLSDLDNPGGWGARIASQEGNSLQLTVVPPPTAYVGQWDLRLDVVKVSKQEKKITVFRYEVPNWIYLLFNPWCKEDSVYLEDQEAMKEYILNDTGRLYSGTQWRIGAKPWNYGQFDDPVLDVALRLLDQSDLSWNVRGNPVLVSRKLSALLNAEDDNGVLEGNWTGKYTGGRSPLAWTGSVPILKQYWYLERPVKYGQCWVFSGITTSILRSLGIPTRSVTNFASAHDKNGSITIDRHLDFAGEVDEWMSRDSVWNFHVWNEAWMARPDLPAGYGGWQAVDATPQECSDGVYCCGPVPVEAIKNGEVTIPYDGQFIFAEVNADRITWQPDLRGRDRPVAADQRAVGKFISTKAPGSNMRLDLTGNYKHPEGSPAERTAVYKANQGASNRGELYKPAATDVEFSLDDDSSTCLVGNDFRFFLKVKNTSSESRTVHGRTAVRTMYYTGVVADKITSDPFTNLTLKPGEEKCHEVVVEAVQYLGRLKDCCLLDVAAWAYVAETSQIFTERESFVLAKPQMQVQLPDQVTVGQEFEAKISFQNPLSQPLTSGFVAVDGLGPAIRVSQRNVAPMGKFETSIYITPRRAGQRELIFIFSSQELDDVNVVQEVTVSPAPTPRQSPAVYI